MDENKKRERRERRRKIREEMEKENRIQAEERRNFREEVQTVKERYHQKKQELAASGEHVPTQREEWRAVTKHLFSLKSDSAPHDEIRDRLLSGGQVSGTNMCVMVCAILIASVGLSTNSTAVIIGAMLISPLMGSILAVSYGTVSADYSTVRKHLEGFVFQILFSVGTATVFFLLNPDKTATTELLNRTNPGFTDVIIAIAGGIAGIIGQTRRDKANNIIPGVAIATALMPPLCTCGYAIANLNFRMLAGASYLFLVNSYFIYMSACIVLALLKIPQTRTVMKTEWMLARRKMVRNAIFVSLPSVVFGVLIHIG